MCISGLEDTGLEHGTSRVGTLCDVPLFVLSVPSSPETGVLQRKGLSSRLGVILDTSPRLSGCRPFASFHWRSTGGHVTG